MQETFRRYLSLSLFRWHAYVVGTGHGNVVEQRFDLEKPRRSYTLAKCTYRLPRIGERSREHEEEEKEEREEQEKEKKSPDPASKRLDSEPKRNKLLRELVAVVALPRSFVPPFFL